MLEKEEEEKNISDSSLNIKEKEKNIFISNSPMNFYKYILNETNSEIIGEMPKSFNVIYSFLRNKSFTIKTKAVTILYKIIEKLTESQIEYNLFRELLLEKSFIFITLIQIYISNNKDDNLNELLSKSLKCLLIGNIEMINILMNIFPATLFEKIQNDPEPINWIIEWDEFFKIIQQDYSEAKLIWNNDCRQELFKFIENILINYEKINLINIKKKSDKNVI